MNIVPLTFRTACRFVELHHRHHKKPQGCKFAIGCEVNGHLVGVAISGRPVSKILDDGETLEITRVCTDGTKNACSKLYGAVSRIAKEMGYARILTYILDTEMGSSLKASGFKCDMRVCGGGRWDCQSRPRIDKAPIVKKQRFVKFVAGVK